MFDAFYDVEAKAQAGNEHAKRVMQSWADADWFTSRADVPEKITVTVFKVNGETNTDDLSPAPDAWSRPDIPLHAQAMLKSGRAEFDFNPVKEVALAESVGLGHDRGGAELLAAEVLRRVARELRFDTLRRASSLDAVLVFHTGRPPSRRPAWRAQTFTEFEEARLQHAALRITNPTELQFVRIRRQNGLAAIRTIAKARNLVTVLMITAREATPL